ncbi:PAS domain S-box protein [Limisphaera sp. 4302-co]|uniref:hybrid sensor histidine kinase/response regulator n=1 Tax=Limisphaera sp. 4302-co TaxID=3400417 RepID=UPI003C23E159
MKFPSRKTTLWSTAVAALIGYGAWIWWYEGEARRVALADLERHAAVVAPALWHLDPAMCRDYLQLAASSKGYQYLRVEDETGTPFVTCQGQPLGGMDVVLHRLGLIPAVSFQRPVVHEKDVLGRIVGVWYVRTVYAEVLALCGLIVGLVLLERHLQVREMRDRLQGQVEDRTRELAAAHAALAAREAQYRSSVEQSPDLFCRFTADGTLTYVNPAYCRFFGRNPDELVGSRFLSFIPEEDRAPVESVLRARLRPDMEPLTLDHRVRAADGELRWIRWTNSAIRDDQGRFLEYQAIGHDITEQKRAEMDLVRSHELYRRAISAAAAVPYEIDLVEDRYLFVGEGIRSLTGYAPDELAPRELWNLAEEIVFLGACAGLNLQEAFQRLTAGRLEQWRADYRLRTRAGEIRWISDTAVPTLTENGQVRGMLGILLDITDRRRMEEEHARLAAAVESVDEAVFVTDLQGVILYANPALERVTGYDRNEVIGRTPRIFKSGKHPQAFYLQMWATIREGRSWTGRVTNRRKDGRLYEAELTISPVRDGSGRLTYYVAVSRDITQQLALEEQLRESQKLEAIGRLAAGVAHEFNNLLTIIQGNALLMDRDALSPEDATCVDQIVHATQRAADLTHRLLLYSRKKPMQMRAVDPGDLLLRGARMLEPLLGERIRLRLHLGKDLPVLRADPALLEQLLINLAANARDAMPDGGELFVSAEVCELSERDRMNRPMAGLGRYIRLTIRDTGVGIPPEHIPHLFEPFFTTKDVGKGTGLGLAAVYGIVQQHRGWIEVESQVGGGTTFRIHLPVAEESQPAPPTELEVRDLPRGGEGVLVVEDEPSLRRLTETLLQRCGYRVWSASDAREAHKVWEQHRAEIQLLLTDLVLPGGSSGADLAAQFAAQKPELKVLFTSGYFEAQFHGALNLIEGDNFLPKPYRPRQLAEMIRARLDRGR